MNVLFPQALSMDYQIKLSESEKKKLRFLFINPATTISESPYVPLGIAYLAAILEQNNVFVCCLDYQIEELDFQKLRRLIKDKAINIVGITSTTPAIVNAYKIVSFVKTVNPKIKILMGGIHPTVLPEEALSHGADIVVRGEGERTFTELVPFLDGEKAKNLFNIKGISYFERQRETSSVYKAGKKFIHNTPRERITDLDGIPFPARRLFKFPQKYMPFLKFKKDEYSAHLISSRGCTGKCVFCNKQIFSRQITYRSAENIVEEIKMLKDKYGIKEISFADDFFTFDAKRVKEICRLLIKEKLNIKWACSNTRVDVIDKKMFELMKTSGCYRVLFGVESGNNQVLKKIGKDITLSEVKKAFKMAQKTGLLTGGYFIIGHHVDTPRTINQTIKFAKDLEADAVQFTINTPFPGTALYQILKNKGWLLSENWEDYQMFEKPLFFTDKLTPEFILKMYKKAWLTCYLLNYKFILKHLKKLFSGKENFYFYLLSLKQVLKRFLGKRLY